MPHDYENPKYFIDQYEKEGPSDAPSECRTIGEFPPIRSVLDYGDKYLESSPLTDEKVWLSIFSNMANCGNIVVTVADLRMRAEMADEGLKLFKERFRKE